MLKVRIFNANSANLIQWDKFTNGKLIKNLFLPMMKNGTLYYIDNIDTEIYILAINDLLIPLTVNTDQWKNSYVCSPYTHYITYSKEELRFLKNDMLNILFIPVINIIGFILKIVKINKVVIINNWFFSTNLYPNLSKSQIRNITEYLKLKFSGYALVFRSLHTIDNSKMLNSFRENSYRIIPSRKIYYWDPHSVSPQFQKRDGYFPLPPFSLHLPNEGF